MPDLRAVRAFLDRSHLELAEKVAEVCAAEIASLEVPADDDAARSQAREIAHRRHHELLGLCASGEGLY